MSRLVLAVVKTWRELRDPYRPELHYMRGPGPRTLGTMPAKPPARIAALSVRRALGWRQSSPIATSG